MKEEVAKLALLVREFVECIAPQLEVLIVPDDLQTEEEFASLVSGKLTPDETLAQWMQLPDCSYSYMFLGWMAGTGRDVSKTSPIDVEQAVCVALTGGVKTLVINYLDDDDAPKVLN